MDLRHADKLSGATRNVLHCRSDAYERLVVRDDGARGEAGVRRQLEALAGDGLLDPPVPSRQHREALLAGLWLLHDYLDESHAISQGIETPTGSFWHAIMHRREGDFSNAKYWYARCRNHPALLDMGNVPKADELVDLVERVYRSPDDPRYAQAVELQRAEWAALFDHCLAEAGGS